MKLKKLIPVLALVLLVGGAAADHTLEHELEQSNTSTNDFTYNTTGPEDPADLGSQANAYVGFTGIGILMIVWIVFYSIPHRKGFNSLDCSIAANFTTTAVSLMIFPMEWIGGEAVVFMFVLTAGTLGYKRAARR